MTSILHRSLEYTAASAPHSNYMSTVYPASRPLLYATAEFLSALAPHVASGVVPGKFLSTHGASSSAHVNWLVGSSDAWSGAENEEAITSYTCGTNYKLSLAGLAAVAMSPTVALVQKLCLRVPSGLSVVELPHLCPMLRELVLWLDAPYAAGCGHPDVLAQVARRKMPTRAKAIQMPSAVAAAADKTGQQAQHELDWLPLFAFLTVLEIRRESSRAHGLSEIGLSLVLTKMPQLRSLFITGNLTHAGIFVGPALLQKLTAGNDSGTSSSSSAVAIPRLRELDLRGIDSEKVTTAALSQLLSSVPALGAAKNLLRFSFQGSGRNPPTDLVNTIADHLHHLQDLYISCSAISDDNIATLGKCRALTNFRVQMCTQFNGTGFARWSPEQVGTAGETLLRLAVAQCNVDDAGIGAIAAGLHSLQVLELASAVSNVSTPAFAAAIELLGPTLQQMRMVNPRESMISLETMTALAKNAKHLRRLEIITGNPGDNAMRAFVSLCESPLEVLHITSGSVSFGTLATMAENAAIALNLKCLMFGRDTVTAQGWSRAGREAPIDSHWPEVMPNYRPPRASGGGNLRRRAATDSSSSSTDTTDTDTEPDDDDDDDDDPGTMFHSKIQQFEPSVLVNALLRFKAAEAMVLPLQDEMIKTLYSVHEFWQLLPNLCEC